MQTSKQAKGTTGIHGQIDAEVAAEFAEWCEWRGIKKTTALERAICKLIGRKPPPERTAGRPKKDAE